MDGNTIQTDEAFALQVEKLISDPSDLVNLKETQERIRTYLLDPNYSSIFLVDSKNNLILQIGTLEEKPGLLLENQMIETNITHQIDLSDLYLTQSGTIRMDLVVPIVLQSSKKQPAPAFLIFLINPESSLYPLLESNTDYYRSLETLLVRRESGSALYLNSVRIVDNSALNENIPLDRSNAVSVMAVKGSTGSVKGNNYQNVPVMAYIAPIEDSNWKLITEIDQSEINHSVNQLRVIISLCALFLSAVLILVVVLLWRRKTTEISKGLTVSEKKRKDLEEKYALLFNQANDAILLIEENGKIIECNHSAVELYGYSKEELLSLSIANLRSEKAKDLISTDMEKVKNRKSNVFQTVHQKKDGSLISVDVSSRFVSVDNKQYFQSMIRDITEKKSAEDKLRRSEEALTRAQEVSHVGSWLYDHKNHRMERSAESNQILGLSINDQSFGIQTQKMIHPEDIDRVMRIINENLSKGRNFVVESRIVRPDGTQRDIWVESGQVIHDEEGNILAVSGIIQDITEKKAAERELRKNENLLQRIYDLLPVGLWITDEKGKITRLNKMVTEIWGKDILVSHEDFWVFRGRRLPSRQEIKPEDWTSNKTINEGITIRDEMIEIDAYDGQTKTILNYSTPIFDDNGKLEGSIILNLDITELKKAEEQLSAQLDELRRWNTATLGREKRILELKKEINDLLEKQGLPKKYMSAEEEPHG